MNFSTSFERSNSYLIEVRKQGHGMTFRGSKGLKTLNEMQIDSETLSHTVYEIKLWPILLKQSAADSHCLPLFHMISQIVLQE